MRITATVLVILISTYVINASVLDPVIENVIHLKASKPPTGASGVWKKKTIWKSRWVKEWKSAKVTKPVWRKVWSPVQIREWLPIPKPPPGWDTVSTLLVPLHPKPQKVFPKNFPEGQESFAAYSSANVAPLWDPVPYPESQQPPPQPFPEPVHNPADVSCCDKSPSYAFNHQKILEIIGPRYHQASGIFQNTEEYSETVNHLTRLPPEGSTWRSSQTSFRFENLPEFLVPPKFQPLPFSGNVFEISVTGSKPVIDPLEVHNVPRWIPLPPENKPKLQLVTKPQGRPYKFRMPERQNRTVHRELQNPENDLKVKGNPRTQNNSSSDFIQEAQLVGEYHYSEFDLPVVKFEQNKLQRGKEQPKVKQQQKEQSQQPPEESKRKQTTETKKPEVRNQVSNSHIHKKQISNPNFRQQELLVKENFPLFPKNTNQTYGLVNKNQEKPTVVNYSTKLLPTFAPPAPNTAATHFNIQQKSQSYPIYGTAQNTNPPEHGFVLPSNIEQEKKLIQMLNNSTTIALDKPKTPSLNKTNIIELVFARTPFDYNKSLENLQKSTTTTTTEPYEVIFSSSLLSTTEAVTKSPLIIVTPVNKES